MAACSASHSRGKISVVLAECSISEGGNGSHEGVLASWDLLEISYDVGLIRQ